MLKYTVQPGETLGSIAKRFYDNVLKYKDIAKANNITNPDNIKEGMELILPGLESEEESESAPVEVGEMTPFTKEELQQIMPKATEENIEKYLPALNHQMETYEITTPLRKAHFIAQLAHESGNFRYDTENLNYSAKALRAVFGKYFPTDEMAEEYARQPERIACLVYANRMGNGDVPSGDGWKFRGRGLIQLTGFNNYEQCGTEIGIDLIEEPDRLAKDPEVAVAAAGWYWQSRKLNFYADKDDVRKITKLINGGYNGLEDREEYLERAKQVLM